ncbi:MAG: HEAT repeat domain-containing protein [Pirellulales bacterium]
MSTIRLFCFASWALFSLCLVVSPLASRAADPPAPAEKERELLAILRSSSPPADKALACKRLAVHGSSAAAADLARLLPDPQLSSWARIALEAIPGPEVDAALRQSLAGLQGELLVGTINSIGVRRDAGAVGLLAERLRAEDREVASAAAVALGRIGDAPATKALRESLATVAPPVRSAVAEGLILCAERALAGGQAAEAVALYDQVRQAEVPAQRRLEATRGAILARQDQGLELLVEQLRSPDKVTFQWALGVAREFPGTKVDAALAGELEKVAPERAALLLHAMSDRRESIVLTAVIAAAGQGPRARRVAALGALGRVGNASCLEVLLASAGDQDEDVAQAALAALNELPDPSVNARLATLLDQAKGKSLLVLLTVAGQRRIDALPALLKAVDHAEAPVRHQALTALGNTVPAEKLSVLIVRAVQPRQAEDAPVALQALKAACVRMPDREATATELAKALEAAPAATQVQLLPVVAAIGGTKSLSTVAKAARSSDDALRDASSRLLGEWPTIDAAPVLLELAKSGPADKYQLRALRGYIRIARQFVMPDPQRVEMCRLAVAAAHQPAERKMVLEVLKRYPSVESLQLSVQLGQSAELKEDGTQAALAIASKLGNRGAEVLEALSKAGLSKVKLEIIKAEYGAGSNQRDVTAILRKQASDLPLVSLPGATYNEAFGGDPAAGVVKQLRIQYRLNGQAGEATFAENALIILPMPK